MDLFIANKSFSPDSVFIIASIVGVAKFLFYFSVLFKGSSKASVAMKKIHDFRSIIKK